MAGVYIHIPFCLQKCGYCDFYSITDLSFKNRFINSVIDEINSRKSELISEDIVTIYLGGGTPSLLDKVSLLRIFDALSKNMDINSVNEFTIEVNPDDISEQYLKGLLEVGFNRLSIGIQSFNDRILKFMNRRHDSKQAINAVKLAQNVGFSNISIDLIYGIPGMSMEEWKESILNAIQLNVQHISAYHLTFEPGTAFYKKLKSGFIKEISDSDSLLQYELLLKNLRKYGFFDYEISNFSQPGLESKHNSSYWTGQNYFGFGPGAHSLKDGIRRYNVSNLNEYINNINNNGIYYSTEVLSEKDKYNEIIMLGLRTKTGVDLNCLNSNFNKDIINSFNKELDKLLEKSNVVIENNFIKISDKNRFITDKIISDFFIV